DAAKSRRLAGVLSRPAQELSGADVDVVNVDQTLHAVVLHAVLRLLVVQVERRVVTGVSDARTQEAYTAAHGHSDRGLLVLAHYLSVLVWTQSVTDRSRAVSNVREWRGFAQAKRPIT